MQVCNANRDGWDALDTCAAAAYCSPNSRQCLATPCIEGELSCNQEQLQRCAEKGLGWAPVARCQSQALCEQARAAGAGSCAAAVCESGALSCQGTSLVVCRPGGDGVDELVDCGAVGCDALNLACQVETCGRGQERCTGARHEACNDSRTGFDLVETCASEALCRQTGNNARCIDPRCSPGETECRRRAVLAVCNADRTGFDEIDCGDAGCNDDQDPARCGSAE